MEKPRITSLDTLIAARRVSKAGFGQVPAEAVAEVSGRIAACAWHKMVTKSDHDQTK